MNPLHIHFFTSYVHEQGTYFRYHNLATGLVRLGQQVTIYGCDVDTGAKARTEVRDGVRYEIVPESWKTSIFSSYNHPLTTLRRRLMSYPNCDVGHLFQPFWGAAAAWSKCNCRVRFYDWDDQWTDGLFSGPITSWRQRWPRFITRRLEDNLPGRADHVTTISHYLANRARERRARRVTVLNSGAWPRSPTPPSEARTVLGLQPNALYVGFMGYTIAELPWCLEAVAANLNRHPRLRFAVCGAAIAGVDELPPELRERIDFLGRLPVEQTRLFADALDLALLPMEDNTFNRSRLPQKYGDHMASGRPLLCSDVGECRLLNDRFPWVRRAGTTKAEWLRAFAQGIDRIERKESPPADLKAFAEHFSWEVLSRRLLELYRSELTS